MKKTNNKGFSLVELIIVVAIMAILIGVLAPQYIKYVEKSRVSADEDTMDSLTKAVQTAVTDDDYYQEIATGDTITINKTNTVVGGSANGLQAAISEFYGKVDDTRFKSKEYNGATCTIEVSELKNADGVITGYTALRKVSGAVSADKNGEFR
ncbi:MAG: prepilin-type N-terminal cleavage/methylation domain-containing protein [Lachnospiraceae bacterium]|nr:prepilin-type N-terminal cleavage/methylation domain-containing protein [Lachnospiraceae bacterium]